MKPGLTINGLLISTLVMLGACTASPSIPVSKTNSDDAKAQPVVVDKTGASNTPVSTEVVNTQAEALAILNKACVSCHNATNVQGGFGNVDNTESMLAGGRYLVAGSPEKSLLFTKLAPTGNMPPTGAMKPEEVATIKAWISGLKST